MPGFAERTTRDNTGSKGCRLSDRLGEAVEFARRHHGAQVRKGTETPYLFHLLAVAALAIEDASSDVGLADRLDDVAVAAVLHDTLEDTAATPEELEELFGREVRCIVEGCSDACDPARKPPWRTRKEAYLTQLEDADDAVLCVALADKLHNARCIVADVTTWGPGVWDRFSAGPADQVWYFDAVVRVMTARRPGRATDELAGTVARLGDLAGRDLPLG